MTTKQRVGVIGIGQRGMGVAKRLLAFGYPVRVRDIRREAEDEARAAGAVVCESPAVLAAACDVAITLVVDEAQTEEVVFGPNGAAATLASGAVLVMSSTVAPAFAGALAARLAEHGVDMLDAPVSGGPAKAHAGTMSMMLAGADVAYERALPVLEAISGARFRIGARAGDGSRMKIVNNMLAGVNLVAACEAVALGIRLGLDARTVFDVVNASSGASWMFGDRMPRVLAGDYVPKAALDVLTKDLSIVLGAAREARFPVPVASAAHQVYVAAQAAGLGREDDAALVKLYQSLTGILLPGE
jgi:3-hydroxyisobutyrate dehydrogenase